MYACVFIHPHGLAHDNMISVHLEVTMDQANFISLMVAVILHVYSSAPGGCSPAPPNTLISSGPSGALGNGNVPNILLLHAFALNTLFRSTVGA